MKKFDHLVTINKEANKIVIYRIFEDGSRHLYTKMIMPTNKNKLKDFCRHLGENLLVDTTDGRKILEIND